MILSAPIYPPDGNVDQRFPGQFVFFHHKTLDIVLAYRTAPDAPRTIHRIKRPPHFDPKIVTTVSKKLQGGFRYRYVVTNGETSGQPLHRWFLSVPQPKAADPTKPAPQKQLQRGAWEQGFYGIRPGQWTVRFDSRPVGRPLSPSESATFVVDNENRPGIVSAYFQRAASSANPLPDDLPSEARKQLEEVKRSQGWDNTVRWTVGPEYRKTATSREVAGDFHVWFQKLVRRRVLDRESPFVKEVLARLGEFIQRPRPWGGEDVPWEVYESLAVDEPFQPIGQSPDPRSSVEQQLDLALKLSLVRP